MHNLGYVNPTANHETALLRVRHFAAALPAATPAAGWQGAAPCPPQRAVLAACLGSSLPVCESADGAGGAHRRSVEPLSDTELRAFLSDNGGPGSISGPVAAGQGPPGGAAGGTSAFAQAAACAPASQDSPCVSDGVPGGDDRGGGQALTPERAPEGGADSDARNMSLGEGVGPPIGVSLPDEDLVDLRAFIRGSLPLPHTSPARSGSGAPQPAPKPDPSPSPNPAPPPPTPASSANLDQLLGMGDARAGSPIGGGLLLRAGSRGAPPSYIAAGARQGAARGAVQEPPWALADQRYGAGGLEPQQGEAEGARQHPAERHRPAGGSGKGAGAGQLSPKPDPGFNLGEAGHARGELTAAAAGLLQATRGPPAQAEPGARRAEPLLDSAGLRRVRAPASAVCRVRGLQWSCESYHSPH